MRRELSEFIIVAASLYLLLYYILTNLTVNQRLATFTISLVVYYISLKIYTRFRGSRKDVKKSDVE